jgi:SAM-dependent methyltransferase
MPDLMSPQTFDRLADCYDCLVDWPRRLAREGRFFRRWFEAQGVRRVADLACGTGHHAALFHSWGLDVEGSDISPAMLEQCRRLHGEGAGLRWVERSLNEPVDEEASFDAVVCLGNSLGLAGDLPAIQHALRLMVGAVRPGGVGVVQVLNLWAVAEGPTKWQRARWREVDGRPVVIIKGIHRVGHRGYVDILEARADGGEAEFTPQSATFLGITARQIREAVGEAGGAVVAACGSHDGSEYDESSSEDLIVVWRRGGAVDTAGAGDMLTNRLRDGSCSR